MYNQKFINDKIINLLKKNMDTNISLKKISYGSNISDLGLSSINLIKIIVNLEEEFQIQFEDKDLNLHNFKTIKKMGKRISELLKNNNK